jgi:hypothetical protein
MQKGMYVSGAARWRSKLTESWKADDDIKFGGEGPSDVTWKHGPWLV